MFKEVKHNCFHSPPLSLRILPHLYYLGRNYLPYKPTRLNPPSPKAHASCPGLPCCRWPLPPFPPLYLPTVQSKLSRRAPQDPRPPPCQSAPPPDPPPQAHVPLLPSGSSTVRARRRDLVSRLSCSMALSILGQKPPPPLPVRQRGPPRSAHRPRGSSSSHHRNQQRTRTYSGSVNSMNAEPSLRTREPPGQAIRDGRRAERRMPRQRMTLTRGFRPVC